MTDQVKPFAPLPDPKNNLPEDFKGEKVLVSFPVPVKLRLQNNNTVSFEPGVKEVPIMAGGTVLFDKNAKPGEELHWYLRGHKAVIFKGKPNPPVIEKTDPPPPVDLSKMTKSELVGHAKDVHGLELKESDKKEDLIASIEAAAAKK